MAITECLPHRINYSKNALSILRTITTIRCATSPLSDCERAQHMYKETRDVTLDRINALSVRIAVPPSHPPPPLTLHYPAHPSSVTRVRRHSCEHAHAHAHAHAHEHAHTCTCARSLPPRPRRDTRDTRDGRAVSSSWWASDSSLISLRVAADRTTV